MDVEELKARADLVATVTFLTHEVGGRATSVHSGYRGQFFFNGADRDVVHLFDFPYDIPQGEEVTDYILFANRDNLSQIHEGLIFLIREGPNTVGYGQVVVMRKQD